MMTMTLMGMLMIPEIVLHLLYRCHAALWLHVGSVIRKESNHISAPMIVRVITPSVFLRDPGYVLLTCGHFPYCQSCISSSVNRTGGFVCTQCEQYCLAQTNTNPGSSTTSTLLLNSLSWISKLYSTERIKTVVPSTPAKEIIRLASNYATTTAHLLRNYSCLQAQSYVRTAARCAQCVKSGPVISYSCHVDI